MLKFFEKFAVEIHLNAVSEYFCPIIFRNGWAIHHYLAEFISITAQVPLKQQIIHLSALQYQQRTFFGYRPVYNTIEYAGDFFIHKTNIHIQHCPSPVDKVLLSDYYFVFQPSLSPG